MKAHALSVIVANFVQVCDHPSGSYLCPTSGQVSKLPKIAQLRRELLVEILQVRLSWPLFSHHRLMMKHRLWHGQWMYRSALLNDNK
jgi:hypothetical protein